MFDKKSLDIGLQWQRSMLKWVEDFWPTITLSTQQKNACIELSKLINAKLKKAWGKPMTEEEIRYSKKIGLSIQSGNGTGKDFILALMILYITFMFPMAKNSATANTEKQLKNVLWSEIAKLMRLAKKQDPTDKETIIQKFLELQSEKLFVKEHKGKEAFCEAVTVNTKASGEDQAQSVAGRHEDFQIWAVDEGSNIADPVYEKIERTLTRMMNLMIIIFNPLRSLGYAIRSQTDPRFISLRWSAEDSELVTQDHIENMAKYGRDSNSFRVGVLGLPPLVDASVLIPLDWLEDAFDREYEPRPTDVRVKALDPGGGGDPSVIGTRWGHKFYPFKYNNSPDSTVVEDWAIADIRSEKPDVTFIDKNLIGHGIYGTIRKRIGRNVRGIEPQRKASDEDRFANLRAEMYYNLRDNFEEGLICLSEIPEEQRRKLREQVGATKLAPDTKKIQIIRKTQIRNELQGDSPDELDDMAMMYSKKEHLIESYKDYDDRDEEESDYDRHKKSGRTWMST